MNLPRLRTLLAAWQDGSIRAAELLELRDALPEVLDTHSTAQKRTEIFGLLCDREIPCGHKVDDLIYGGTGSITKCARCIIAKRQ